MLSRSNELGVSGEPDVMRTSIIIFLSNQSISHRLKTKAISGLAPRNQAKEDGGSGREGDKNSCSDLITSIKHVIITLLLMLKKSTRQV